MENDIKKQILTIAKLLNHCFNLIGKEDYEKIKHNINNIYDNELSRLSCYFLNIAMTNPLIMFLLKNEFKKIYDIYNKGENQKHNIDSFTIIKNQFMSSNYTIFLDHNFTKKNITISSISELNVLVNRKNKNLILSSLYELGADITEDELYMEDESTIYFYDNLKLKIYYYNVDSNNNIIFSKKINDNQKRNYIFSPNMVELGYKYDHNKYYERVELKYLSLILSGTPEDYIEAYNYKGKINIKKVQELKKQMKYYDERLEVEHELQKTCRHIVS